MMQAIVARSGARRLVGKGYIKDIAWFFLLLLHLQFGLSSSDCLRFRTSFILMH
jgi:hypothetical protein